MSTINMNQVKLALQNANITNLHKVTGGSKTVRLFIKGFYTPVITFYIDNTGSLEFTWDPNGTPLGFKAINKMFGKARTVALRAIAK